MGGSVKKKFMLEVKQTNHFEVVIEADSEEEAEELFKDYMTEDFGDPVNSMLEYAEFVETT